jgi:hypothetical protein
MLVLLLHPMVIVVKMTQLVLTIRHQEHRKPSMLHFGSSGKLAR